MIRNSKKKVLSATRFFDPEWNLNKFVVHNLLKGCFSKDTDIASLQDIEVLIHYCLYSVT